MLSKNDFLRSVVKNKIAPNVRNWKLPINDIYIKESKVREESLIYVSNHNNSHDIPTSVDYIANEVCLVARKSNDLTLDTKLFFDMLGVIYTNDESFTEKLSRILKDGKEAGNILIFPEGIYNFSPNQLVHHCKWSVAKSAIENNVGVVPMLQEYEGFNCYLNEGNKLYFYEDSYENSTNVKKRLFMEYKTDSYKSGNKVIIVVDNLTNEKVVLSKNFNFNTIDDINAIYKEDVNNSRNIEIVYIHHNIDKSKAMNVIRDEIATMKWYLYEYFGIVENNEKLRKDFENLIENTKKEYPALDYDYVQSTFKFNPYTEYDDVFLPLENLESNNKNATIMSASLQRVRNKK